ncbi:hypothetical protein ENTCAN_06885 [Enterobacter cancerogenus ATCC 35316]|nr:hypothetical protein ENTCAN_06885 [Enterobacter cancerogenus ATCC 35316]
MFRMRLCRPGRVCISRGEGRIGNALLPLLLREITSIVAHPFRGAIRDPLFRRDTSRKHGRAYDYHHQLLHVIAL